MNESENLLSVDQLLDVVEQLTGELEAEVQKNDQLSEQLSEAQETISDLSSENSELRSEVQKKSEEIVKYEGADLILEENERLKKSNQECRAETKKSQEETEAVKTEYYWKNEALASKERRLDREEADLKEREKNLDKEVKTRVDKEVDKKVDRMEYRYCSQYEKRSEEIEEEYQKKKKMILLVMMVSLLYSIGTTTFTAIMNKVVYKDVVQFFGTFFKGVGTMLCEEWKGAGEMAEVSNQIESVILAKVVHAAIQVIPVILINVLLIGIIGYFGYLYFDFMKEKQVDIISIAAILVVLAVTVFFAGPIKSIVKMNILTFQILLYAIYSLVRGVIQMEDHEERRTVVIYSCAIAFMIIFICFFINVIIKR